MTAEGDDPLTKMAISATQLTLFFTIFFAIFLDCIGQIFSDSAGPSLSGDPVGFAIFASQNPKHLRGRRNCGMGRKADARRDRTRVEMSSTGLCVRIIRG
jgi:hypothetical protein